VAAVGKDTVEDIHTGMMERIPRRLVLLVRVATLAVERVRQNQVQAPVADEVRFQLPVI
jgi:hypothetical protein